MRFFLLAVFLLPAPAAFRPVSGQDPAPADSLVAALPAAKGEDRLELLIRIVEELDRRSPDTALVYCEEGLALAQTLEDLQSEARLRVLKSTIHRSQSAYDAALAELDLAYDLVVQLDDSLQQARMLYRIGAVHTVAGSLDEALDYYLRSMPLAEAIEDDMLTATLLAQIGLVYQTEGLDAGDPDKLAEALDFYRRSATLKEALDMPGSLANTLGNMGTIYRAQKDYEQSLEVQSRALEIRRSIGDRIGEARSLNNTGMVYLDQERLEEARSMFEESNAIKRELGLIRDYVNGLLNVADVYIAAGSPAEAMERVIHAREVAEDVDDFITQRRLRRTESQAFEATGEFEEALSSYKAFKAADDSLRNEANRDRLADLQTQYQTREKEQEIAILQRDNEIQTLYRRLLMGGLAALALLIFLLYSRFRIKAKSNMALTEANNALSESMQRLTETQDRLIHAEKMASLGQLTAGIAHEIKNPLNFINNFADLNEELVNDVMERFDDNPDLRLKDVREDLEDLRANAGQISKHGSRADGIVKSMLEHSRIAPGEEREFAVNEVVEEYVNLAYHGARATAQGFNLTLERNYDEEAGKIKCVPQEIGRVLINLLDNAFFAVRNRAEENSDPTFVPTVTVTTRRSGDRVALVIKDNGGGIPREVIGRIFEPFFTTKPTGTGTGLGLSLSYDIITRGNNGSMSVENLPEGGACFEILLPRTGSATPASRPRT